MSTIDRMTRAIEEFDGRDPDSGVSLALPANAYAVYADNYSLELEDFSEWRLDAEDAYAGEFDSDEEFAQSVADGMGVDINTPEWPHSCIDWAQAARELMYDYFSDDDYYFREV